MDASEAPHVEALSRYVDEVVSGQIPACKWVRAACQRHLNDLQRVGAEGFPFHFDVAAAERVCAFAELFPHVKGEWAKQHLLIRLEPWECFILGCTFGWKKPDGRRRFREIYAEIPRKNGKSVLAAIIGNYMFIGDGEVGAEVYSGATTEKQAWEVFGPARLMMSKSPDIVEDAGVTVGARAMFVTDDQSKFHPVIGNPGDGASPSCAIVDEYHEHATAILYDTMISGMGARAQPILAITTTAGVNLASPCHDKHTEAIKVLDGLVENDDLFAIIYTIDEKDDWADPAVLPKANPNYGVSVDPEYLLSQQRQAVLNPGHQNRFKTKHLNVWCNAAVAGINMAHWRLCADRMLDLTEFYGQECWFILDLASKLDICAFIMLFRKFFPGVSPKGEPVRIPHYYVFGRYYLPEDTVSKDVVASEKANQDAYRRWQKQGHLITTPGAELDFETVQADVLDLKSKVQVKEVVYDPWRATQLAQQLTKAGATCVEFPNGAQFMASGYDELKAALAAGRFHHDDNPVFAWMASNTVERTITKGLSVPSKDKPVNKIDGVVGTCMGLSRALTAVSTGGIEDWLRDPVHS